MWRIGIMSFAHVHAGAYASALNALPHAELGAIWDDNARRGRRAAREFGAPFKQKLETFFAADLDGVIVCSENVHHREHVEQAAAAGLWVLCEKPLAPAAADAQAMIRACRKAGVGLGVAFPCRFVPPIQQAQADLMAGTYGNVLAVSATNHGSFPGGWFADDALAGGGAVMDHTVHVADVLRWILGREFTRVYCEAGNQLHKKRIDTDDLGVLQLEMEGGVQVSHIGSWSRPESFPTWGDVTLEIVCEGGVVSVDAFNQKVHRFSDRDGRVAWVPFGSDANRALVNDFVRAIEERRDPLASGEDGLRATQVTVAAYESWRAGKPVRIKK